MMENAPKFESDKRASLSEKEGSETQESPEDRSVMDRRTFLGLMGGAALSLVIPEETLAKQEKREAPTVKLEVLLQGKQRKMVGESTGLNALHAAVSNNFEKIIEGEVKKSTNKFSIGNFKATIGQKNGKYILEYSVDLTPVEKEEEAHRVIGVRGKVWSGVGAKKGTEDLYQKEIGPWQQRIRNTYPEMEFTSEAQSGGVDTLYQRVCLMKGAKRK